jgi:hypothetical protein
MDHLEKRGTITFEVYIRGSLDVHLAGGLTRLWLVHPQGSKPNKAGKLAQARRRAFE